MGWLSALFEDDGFVPHGLCLLWQPDLILLHSVSDALITVSYYSIPIALINFVSKRRDIEFRWMFVLFGVFILACGTSHLFGIVTLWHPYYIAEGLVKAITAATSLVTAGFMWRVMPEALAIPGKQQLEKMNQDLETQIRVRQIAERSLTDLNSDLERRVSERTTDLERSNTALTREIAERRHAEHSAQESERRFRNLVEGSIQAIVIHRDGVPLFANQAYADMFGCGTPEAVLALGSIARFVAPEEVEHVDRLWAATRQNDSPSAELEYKACRSDGSNLWAFAQARMISWEGRPAIQVALIDITDRKEAEELVRQTQKMEAIGHLTGGLAHDFNNLIAIVVGNLELLSGMIDEGSQAKKICDAASRAAWRGADLTRQLLAFSRRQPLAPKRIDIDALVADMVELLGRTLGEEIEIVFQQGSDPWPVVVDSAQLRSAVMNLATNSRDSMPGGGTLNIKTENVVLDADYTAANPDVLPGEYVSLSVSDTGTGIPPEVLHHVFEPFFTTKAEGKGTGLGLSMVFGFIKQSGGHINIHSEVGQGTVIRMYLPRAPETEDRAATDLPQRAAGSAPASEVMPKSRGETVLVVEDNPDVRSSAIAQLQALGYKTVDADRAETALAILNGDARIDLLFTDMVMPGGIDGRQLAAAATALRPNLKVLFTSGYFDSGPHNPSSFGPGDILLSKPYHRHDLAIKVREALDRVDV